jgi:hypothetical protein
VLFDHFGIKGKFLPHFKLLKGDHQYHVKLTGLFGASIDRKDRLITNTSKVILILISNFGQGLYSSAKPG